MIESGLITEINERAKSPFDAIILQYSRQQFKQARRAERRKRPMLPREQKVIQFCSEAIGKISLLEA